MVQVGQIEVFATGLVAGIKEHSIKEAKKGGFEAVGFLARPRGTALITSRVSLNNHSHDPTKGFFVEPWEQFRAEQKLAGAGYEIVGVYHSHPSSEAQPSQTDVMMARPGELVVIYSVAFDDLQVWKETAGHLVPVDLELGDG